MSASGNTGMVVGSLIGITALLTFSFTLCTCCIVRCFRPQRSPGPAWYPDQNGNRRVVNRWNDNDHYGYVFARRATINDFANDYNPPSTALGRDRLRASFGHIAGFGYEAAVAS
jgi:hypothetical protein